MPTFIFKNQLVPSIRENGWQPEHEPIMRQHFQYLKDGVATGTVMLAGPCEDQEFGICIFFADSLAEAQQFMENDPAITNGIMTAEVHPFRISLLGNVPEQ